MMVSRRRAAGVAILLAWSVIVGWHIRREYFKPASMVLAQGARGLAPGSYYYVVRMKDAAIGFARTRFDTLATGYIFEDNIILDVPALDTVHRAMATTRIDLGLAHAPGSMIMAVASGTVAFAGGDPCCSYGLYVIVDHGNGLKTLYAHLRRLDVSKGQSVSQGQVLGPAGSTGYSTGVHLHFEVHRNGTRVDPLGYLP